MFELQSCKITGRETRSDESKEEYVYPSELIYINKVPTLVDCLNHTLSVFCNKDTLTPICKKSITFLQYLVCMFMMSCSHLSHQVNIIY